MKKILMIVIIVILTVSVGVTGIFYFIIQNAEVNDEKITYPSNNIIYQLPDEVLNENSLNDIVIDSDGNNEVQEIDSETEPNEEVEVETEQDEQLNLLKNKLNAATEQNNRVNFVVFAHDGLRADTIMFVSYDEQENILDVISIPRDTLWIVEGYTFDVGNQKINAVYGRGNNLGGSKGMRQAISDLLQVPINYYIKINYNGAAEIIDALDGVEIDVFKRMKYDDPYAEPPLHIDIDAGLQTLNGEDAVDYLRWRQNNDKQDKEGDLPRISRMQAFMKAVIKKAMSTKIVSFVNACFENIYTDLELDYGTKFAIKAAGIDFNDVNFHLLPGSVSGYFYVMDQEDTLELLIDIYSSGNESVLE